MDDIIERIKEYVVILDSSIDEDEDIFDLVVNEIVDRFLMYTNRYQLVEGYERFLDGEYYRYNSSYDIDGEYLPILPVPTQVERVLARVIVSIYKSDSEGLESTTGAVASISDNGQSISYNNDVIGYLTSKEDSEIFSSVRKLLDKFRLPTIVENT